MTEIRKKLTETQFRLLVNAQMKYDQLLGELQAAATEVNTVRALVMDAHEVGGGIVTSFIDAATQELVFEKEDEEKDEEEDEEPEPETD